MKNITVTSLMLFLLPFIGQATIGILQINPSSTGCNGSIRMVAEGTAGPFKVTITNENGYNQVLNNINGVEDITGLCVGNYSIEVISELFPFCPKIMYGVIQDSGGLSIMTGEQPNSASSINGNQLEGLSNANKLGKLNKKTSENSMIVYPNPFQKTINILLRGVHHIQKIEIVNSIGQIIETVNINGQDFFTVDLGKSPASMYIIKALLKDGQVVETRQVVRME